LFILFLNIAVLYFKCVLLLRDIERTTARAAMSFKQ
jgi:hypothetical protein